MSSVTVLPYSRPLTADDMDSMPDDGHRYELIDGTLIVSPAPLFNHQMISAGLLVVLRDASPENLVVLTAPFEIRLDDSTVVQPDLLVAPRDAFTPKNLPRAPLLAVEILSPSTALIDLNLKEARFEVAGVPSYWIIDPDGPRLRVFELGAGGYELVVDVSGLESWTAAVPFTVEITPARLLA